jgi:hypothetical protein
MIIATCNSNGVWFSWALVSVYSKDILDGSLVQGFEPGTHTRSRRLLQWVGIASTEVIHLHSPSLLLHCAYLDVCRTSFTAWQLFASWREHYGQAGY